MTQSSGEGTRGAAVAIVSMEILSSCVVGESTIFEQAHARRRSGALPLTSPGAFSREPSCELKRVSKYMGTLFKAVRPCIKYVGLAGNRTRREGGTSRWDFPGLQRIISLGSDFRTGRLESKVCDTASFICGVGCDNFAKCGCFKELL